MNSKTILDTYALRAQLSPALLTLLPLGLAVISWAGKGPILVPAVATALGGCGACFALAVIARNQGRNLQPKLWAAWGGSPTIQLLRHRGTANPILRERWHTSLEKLIGKRFPTKEEETTDPEAADSLYEAAIHILITKERKSPSIPLIARENTNYGFCRNLLALKPIGIATALLGTAGSGATILTSQDNIILSGVCTALSGVILLIWLLIVDKDWPKSPAFAYAERLLESTLLDTPKRTRTPRSS